MGAGIVEERAEHVGVRDLQGTDQRTPQPGLSEGHAQPFRDRQRRFGADPHRQVVEHIGEAADDDLKEKVLLGVPVQVRGALADVGPLGDRAHRHALEPLFHDELLRGCEDLRGPAAFLRDRHGGHDPSFA